MRAAILWTATVVVAAVPVQAQQTPLADALRTQRGLLTGLAVPTANQFTTGNREIAAGTTAKGPVAIVGTLRVLGTIDGDAFTYSGDIIVPAGGHITGSVLAILGEVRAEGEIDGESRWIRGDLAPIAAIPVAETTTNNIALTLGWASVVLIIGIGVLIFGGRTLDVVGATVEQQFGRSFLVGLGTTLAMLPALALLVIGLTLTILGVLLIPFAIVAYVLAAIGLVTLGFLVAVRMTGHALGKRGSGKLSDRGAAVRALVIGVTVYLGLWLIAALATPWPTVEWIARLIAFAATWAAATVGLGATVISRAGSRPVDRVAMPASGSRIPLEHEALAVSGVPEWQTPTPVSGVVAARRRPSAAHKSA